jgi:hypothetical protein
MGVALGEPGATGSLFLFRAVGVAVRAGVTSETIQAWPRRSYSGRQGPHAGRPRLKGQSRAFSGGTCRLQPTYNRGWTRPCYHGDLSMNAIVRAD